MFLNDMVFVLCTLYLEKANPKYKDQSTKTVFLDHFRCRNPVELFAKSGSRQRLAVLSRRAPVQCDSLARARARSPGAI